MLPGAAKALSNRELANGSTQGTNSIRDGVGIAQASDVSAVYVALLSFGCDDKVGDCIYNPWRAHSNSGAVQASCIEQ